MKKTTIILLFVALVVIIAALVAYANRRPHEGQAVQRVATTTDSVAMASWKTYVSEPDRFSIDIPSDYSVIVHEDPDNAYEHVRFYSMESSDIYIWKPSVYIHEKKPTQSLEDWLDVDSKRGDVSRNKGVISGYSTIDQVVQTPTQDYRVFYFGQGGTVAVLMFALRDSRVDDSLTKTDQDILESFRFR